MKIFIAKINLLQKSPNPPQIYNHKIFAYLFLAESKGRFDLFQNTTNPITHCPVVTSCLVPHAQLIYNSPGLHYSKIPSTVFHLTWHNVVLEKGTRKLTFVSKPSLCFAYLFLKFKLLDFLKF